MAHALQRYIKNKFFDFIDFISGAKRARLEDSPFNLKKQRRSTRADKVLVVPYQPIGDIDGDWNQEFVVPFFWRGDWLLVSDLTGRPLTSGRVVDFGFPFTSDDLIAKTIAHANGNELNEELLMYVRAMQEFINNAEIGAEIGMNEDGTVYLDDGARFKSALRSN